MKNPPRFILSVACAACMAAALQFSLAGEPTPQPLQAPQPLPTPAPAPTAAPLPTPAPAPPISPSQPPAASSIPFNTQNKEIAKSIYQTMRDIQETEFDPAANMAAITKLQDAVAQTDFCAVPQIDDYVKDSLTLNTLRSRDIKIQRSDAGKDDKEKGTKSGAKLDAGMFTASGGIED